MNYSIKKTMLPLLIVYTMLLISSCKQATEPRLAPELALTLEDVSCTEAWIQLTTTNLQLPATLTLYKNNVAHNNILCYGDTLLYIDSLLPNQTYKFKVVLTNNPQPTTYPQPPTSNEVTVTTMDTTSHEFSWQSWEFGGDCGSSSLYDVAIIDENNIWAVGEIYLRDSLGNCDPNAYNAVHWDGTKWELKRIPIYLGSGFPFYPVIKSIFAFSENNIWFEAGIHWDGISFKQVPFNIQWNGNVNKLWGSSSEDLYAVGNNGNIAHWDGRKWTKIESGTSTDINDIWGIKYSTSNSSLVLCTVSNRDNLGEYKLLSIFGNITKEYFSLPYTRLYGVWFNSSRSIYIVGDGAFVYKNNFLRTIDLGTNYFLTRVKGNGLNDIYISSSDAKIYHYNGLDWKEQNNYIFGKYEGMDVKGNTIALVGYNIEGVVIDKAIITIGKHK